MWIAEFPLAPTLTEGAVSMIIYSIYKIVNLVNGKVYVGMTRQGEKRFKKHIALANSKSPQILVQTKIKQHGAENFCFSILYETKDLEHAKKMESYFIMNLETLVPKGYNIHSGGNYCYEFNVSDMTKQRMIYNNPGSSKESLIKKSSVIQAENKTTGLVILVENRKQFSKEYNIPYTSIGWAIQHNRTLKSGWAFSYVKKRTMGI